MGNHRYMCLWYISSWAKYGCEEKIYRRKVVLVAYRARVNKIERERERREFFLSASGAYIVIFRSLTLQASLTTGIPCIWRWEKRLTMLDAMRDRPRFRPHVSLPTSLLFSTSLTMKYIKKCTAKNHSTKARHLPICVGFRSMRNYSFIIISRENLKKRGRLRY